MWQAAKICKNFAQFNSSSFCESRLSRACPSCFQMNVVQSLILTSCFVVTAGDIFQVDSIPPLFLSCGAFEYQWPMCRRGFPCYTAMEFRFSNLEYQSSWPALCSFRCSCFSLLFSHKKSKWHDWCGKSLDGKNRGPMRLKNWGESWNGKAAKVAAARRQQQQRFKQGVEQGILEIHVVFLQYVQCWKVIALFSGRNFHIRQFAPPHPVRNSGMIVITNLILIFILIRAMWPHNETEWPPSSSNQQTAPSIELK